MSRSRFLPLALVLLAGCAPAPGPSPLPSSSPVPYGAQATIRVGANAGVVSAIPGSAWVANMADGTVSRIDTATNRVVATVRLGNTETLLAQGCGASSVHAVPIGSFLIRACDLPNAVVATHDAVWATVNDTQDLVRIDPASNRVALRVHLGRPAFGLEAGPTGVWVSDFDDDTVVRVDPAANRQTAVVTGLDLGPTGMVEVAGALWVACSLAGMVDRVDPVSAKVVARIPVGGDTRSRPLPMLAYQGAAWVRSENTDQLQRIDPLTNAAGAPITVSPPEGRDGLDSLAADSRGIWVSGLRLERVDPVAGVVDLRLARNAMAVSAGAGSLWLTDLVGTITRLEAGG